MSQKGICFILNVNIHGQTSQQDPELAMFCHRTAPLSHNIPGPCQLPNSRQLRSNLPVNPPPPPPPTLIPIAPYLEDITAHLQARQEKQKLYHLPLVPGELARLRPDNHIGKWREATVLKRCEELRSYLLTTPQGQLLR